MSADFLHAAAEPIEPWPELIPLEGPDLPRLDTSHLPAALGDFAEALSVSTETPPELAAAVVLATTSAVVAPNFRVHVRGDHFEPCNLWIVCALPPGNRKSAVYTRATAPLIEYERDECARIDAEIKRTASKRKTKEARAKELRNKAAKEKSHDKAEALEREAADIEADLPEIPVQPQLWTSDATPEKLGILLSDHGECMAWLSAEGGIFDTVGGRYSNGVANLDLVLKSHSGDAERVDRTGRPPVFLRRPLLTIGLTPQPEVLRGLATKPGFTGRGLLARFLFLLPPSPVGWRGLESKPVPTELERTYADALRSILEMQAPISERGERDSYILKLSDPAYAEWLEFSRDIEIQMRPGGEMEHCSDWGAKAPGAAARIAGVLHVAKHAHGQPWAAEITQETMASALELMAIITCHSLAARDLMGADPVIANARTLWHWIERGLRDGFTMRDAFNELRSTFPRMADITGCFDVLEERGYLEVEEQEREGRGRPPSPIVRIRPDIARSWR